MLAAAGGALKATQAICGNPCGGFVGHLLEACWELVDNINYL
ncbi:MAG: hypothetical protein QF745_06390 [Planctomycetota bacterium]|nr:hypothetical protein [Planctomycetota bacterium]